jgi:hypothetical protein
LDSSKALAILNNASSTSLVFARREEIETVSPQFEPIVTVLELAQSDFTDVGMGNMYPGKAATNRISDAAGVSFLPNVGGTREVGSWSTVKAAKQAGGFWQAVGEYKIVGSAQGQRLKPDGTPRLSSVREYEFNVVDRANEDFLKDFSKGSDAKYTTEVSALKHLFELKKFATQRASTGAELAVVRELVGMPTAFKKDQIGKPMIFSQIIENNRFKVEIVREIMKSPDGRQAVVGALFGAAQALYGPGAAPAIPYAEKIGIGQEPAEIRQAEDQQTAPGAEDFSDDPELSGAGAVDPNSPEAIFHALEEYLLSDEITEKAKAEISVAINRQERDPIILKSLLSRTIANKKALADKRAGVAPQARSA